MKHKENILRLRAEGKTYNQIVEDLGCAKSTVAYHCGLDQKAKTRYRTRGLREDIASFLIEYKESRGCADCGGKYPYWVLDFDHLGEKEFNLSAYRQVTVNLEKVKKEVSKCEVVCANCHRTRSYTRQMDN